MINYTTRHLLPLIFLFLFSCTSPENTSRGVISEKAMVVTAHPLASEVGVNILKKGGNAVDAAIAVQFTLAVVYPAAGNIGGGGFMVIRPDEGESITLDFREKASLSADKDMYLDENGKVIEDLSTIGHLASGVPGTVAGMVEAYNKFGVLEWEDLLQPAIDLAEYGFTLIEKEAIRLNDYNDKYLRINTVIPDFLIKDRWNTGDTIFMKDLAETLKRIRDMGRSGFYEGRTADLIINEMKRGNGILNYKDLENYQAVWRNPVTGKYKDYKIISMGPPSSGGIALIQMLKMAEPYLTGNTDLHSYEFIHLLAEVEKGYLRIVPLIWGMMTFILYLKIF